MAMFIQWIVDGSDVAKYLAELDPSTAQILMQYSSAYNLEAIVSNLTTIFTFGGTTLLIMVGVAIETFRELEAQLTMRNYKGFLN